MNMHNAHNMCINAHMSSALTHNDKLCVSAYIGGMRKKQYIEREKVIAFLNDALHLTGKSLSRLAVDAGVSHSTVVRYYNNPEPKDEISRITLNKIARSIGVKSYEEYIAQKTINPGGWDNPIKAMTPEELTEHVLRLDRQMRSIIRHFAEITRHLESKKDSSQLDV